LQKQARLAIRSVISAILKRLLKKHDTQDGNGDAHLKAVLVGPSETIPLIAGRLGLSR
jgi:thiamine phosphate synthase YjbQ (UPF0047 family)